MRTTSSEAGGRPPAGPTVPTDRPADALHPGATPPAAGLGIRDLVVRYPSPGRGQPGTVAVDGVSLDVAPGEVVALLGPSGCGKSSLLRAVAGLEPLAGGDVTWDGESVVGVPVHRRGFGLLFQDGQLFAHRDVAGNVGYGLRGPAGASRALARSVVGGLSRGGRGEVHPLGRADRVAELLGLVGLPGQERRDPATLSGGERQRVALARALAPRPRLLLLDEPLSALDRALRERLAQDLRAALLATGTTAVLVTHDQDEAFAVADRVAVMAAGRLLQVATPGELWRAPASREVAAFLGYEAFVPVSAAAAAPLRTALRLAPDDAGTLALAAGALVVRDTARGVGARDAGAGSTIGEDDARAAGVAGHRGVGGDIRTERGEVHPRVAGVVLAVGARRGRAEVTVDVPGLGRLTALAPVGWTAPAGSEVRLDVDADAVARVR